jgi:hypothetical protein
MNETIREILERPFPADQIRKRRGSYGRELEYVQVHNHIARLNLAFAGDWSFDIVEHQVLEDEVVVIGRLTVGDTTKTAFGGSSITKSKDSGERVSITDDLKSAASDSLKKCSSLLGLGLCQYGAQAGNQAPAVTAPRSPESKETATKANRSTPEGSQVPLRISERQLSAILALARSKGGGEVGVRTGILDRYGAPAEQLTRRQASEVISALNNGGLRVAGGGA